jgi:hypothetical protein
MRLGYNILKQIKSEYRRDLLVELISGCNNLYYPVRLVSVLRDEQKKESNSILSGEEVTELEKLLLQKIKASAKTGSLKSEKYFVTLLYRWREWESEDAVKQYVKSFISTREGFLTFLKLFVGRTLSTSGNYDDLNRKSIAGLYPIEEIDTLVNEMSEEDISKMTKKEKLAIELFKHPIHNW